MDNQTRTFLQKMIIWLEQLFKYMVSDKKKKRKKEEKLLFCSNTLLKHVHIHRKSFKVSQE